MKETAKKIKKEKYIKRIKGRILNPALYVLLNT